MAVGHLHVQVAESKILGEVHVVVQDPEFEPVAH